MCEDLSALNESGIHDQVCQKFKILLLVSMGGNLYCRTLGIVAKGVKYDWKVKDRRFYLRPGYNEFLSTLAEHPRACVTFYTSKQI